MNDWLRPGQMVACVDDDWRNELEVRPLRPLPIGGCVYTIDETTDFAGGIYVSLSELGGGIWFLSSHFRPVRPTSINCLTHLLAPSDAMEPA